MALSPERVGKSLARFFKPLRVAQPHRVPLSGPPSLASKEKRASEHGFQLLKFKHDEDGKRRLESQQAAEEEIPATVPKHWLEFVLYLLQVCRKVSKKLNHKAGNAAYRAALMGATQQKIKTLGSIVDVSAEAYEKEDEAA